MLNVITHNTFIIYLLYIGLEKIVQILIAKGANVNVVEENNFSALFIASYKGNVLNAHIFEKSPSASTCQTHMCD